MAESWKFELSVNELRAVCQLVPELVLPVGHATSDLDAGGTADDSELAAAIAEANESLKKRGLVIDHPESRQELVAPALLFALSLHGVAERAIRAFSWSPMDEARELISVNRGACAGIRRVQRRGTHAGAATTRIIVTFMYLGELAKHLLELVADNASGSKTTLRSTTIGLVESRAIVQAIREGDRAFLASLSAKADSETHVDLLSSLTQRLDAGFHLELLDKDARCVYIGDWFRGDDGWISMTVIPSEFPVSSQSLAESGRMRLAKVSRSLIRADLLELVAGLRRTRDVA